MCMVYAGWGTRAHALHNTDRLAVLGVDKPRLAEVGQQFQTPPKQVEA